MENGEEWVEWKARKREDGKTRKATWGWLVISAKVRKDGRAEGWKTRKREDAKAGKAVASGLWSVTSG